MVTDWVEVTLEALTNAWQTILMFLPKLVGAIVVFVIGWVVGVFVEKVVAEILKKLKVDKAFEKTGWQEALEKAEIKISPSSFIGEIFKWMLVIFFLMASVEILGFYQFSQFLGKIVSWLPNVVVASVIFIVAVIVADILEKIIKASSTRMGVALSGFLGNLVRWSIYVFSGFAILLQLGIAEEIVKTVVYGLVFALSLAVGLAFGLGGKEAAAKFIEETKKKISEK